ncbi:ABC transporter permease [Salmonirosea aquatica]|uniref:FtsX-like permease family protein n=1 Tax=Salmonirosea aquatica TaxID=2654236 RepID=A0A7C9FDJ1_9BACT|nr:FtsX-like permease family protein [Cytophagaceae bacterium SJW1-29]
MLTNYLKIAWRNVWKHWSYSLVNVMSLALGMGVCILIGLFVLTELNFDRFWKDSDQVYRINQINSFEEEHEAAYVSIPVGPAVARQVAGVEATTRLFRRSGSMKVALPKTPPQLFQERDVIFVDSAFFQVFTQPLVEGNPIGVLKAPASVVLSESARRKYFGDGNALGEVIRYEDRVDLTVTGVFADPPATTDLKADFLIHFETLFSVEPEGTADFLRRDWLYNSTQTFVRLTQGTPVGAIESQLPGVIRLSNDERVVKHVRLTLQPLHDIHLYSADLSDPTSTGNISHVKVLALIALLTMLIACFNFINLSTAYSLRRIREVGLRKAMGAVRSHLVAQFLGEALVMTALAFAMAGPFVAVLLPFLTKFTGRHFTVTDFLQPELIAISVGLLVATAVLAGTYPAFFITRFQPVQALKGMAGRMGRSTGLRQVLVVAQFAVALILVVATLVLFQQRTYLLNKPLGFQKEQIITLPLFGSGASANLPQGIDGTFRQRMNTFEEAVGQSGSVQGITAASALPGSGYVRSLVVPEGKTEQDNIFVSWMSADYDFLLTLGIPVIAGRDFSKETGTDHLEAFILNESAVKSLGYPDAESAVGRPIQRGGEGGKKGFIIGVVRDFHFNPLDTPLEPLIIDINVPRFTVFAVKVSAQGTPATLEHLKKQWESHFPERPFEYSFLDDTLDAHYDSQETQSQLLGLFSGLAIFISCLGLFGLVEFTTRQRTKEIGIRKVLGASVASVVVLLSKDFLKLVLIAIVIASPVAWYTMHEWLADFAYKIDISWWVFILAGGMAAGIALLTVSFQSVRAALMNPVKSLRSE